MDKETIDYIINYCLKNIPLEIKKDLKYPFYKNQKEFEERKEQIANTVLKDFPDEVNFNNCPKCNKLTRTPFSKQCRYCLHDWH